MDEPDAPREGESIGDGQPAALERIVDPVVAVADGTVSYVNAAATEAFDLSGDAVSRAAGDVLEEVWDDLEGTIDETAVGTARTVALADDRFDARVHRDVDGATVTFDGDADALDRDRVLKDRAIDETPVGVAISDPDREDNPLIYVNDAFQEITGYGVEEIVGRNCRFLQGEDSDPEAVAAMREAIEATEPVTVELKNYRRDGTEFWNEVTIAPVRDDDGTVTNYVGFQNDVTARKNAELEAQRRRTELERVLERVEGLVKDVTAAVAGAPSRDDLEAAVCDRIAAEASYETVWIGERTPTTDTVEARATAGGEESVSVDGDHPAVAALEGDEFVVDAGGETTVAAVPLSYNDVEYGVLTVRTAPGEAVDDREEVVLSALARAVASGINARETSRMLATDAVVAVEVAIADDGLAPAALSALADCELEYRRSVHRTDAETTSLFTATGASMADLEAAATELPGVDLEPVVERESSSVIELEIEDGIVEWLSDRGGIVRTITAADGTATLTLELPRSANVRDVVDALTRRYPETDVRSVQQRDRSDETSQEFARRLEKALTDRQLAALRRAYLGGYFEWPRPTTGEELAASMDVTRPTFHEHLRTAEAKLCRAFFDA